MAANDPTNRNHDRGPSSESNHIDQNRKKKQQGRTFAINQRDPKNTNVVKTSNLAILVHFASCLFDSGSTHSFISVAFVRQAQRELEPLDSVMSISTPSRAALFVKDRV